MGSSLHDVSEENTYFAFYICQYKKFLNILLYVTSLLQLETLCSIIKLKYVISFIPCKNYLPSDIVENLQDLPIISKSGIILMPGQTIPITFFHVSFFLETNAYTKLIIPEFVQESISQIFNEQLCTRRFVKLFSHVEKISFPQPVCRQCYEIYFTLS